MQRSIGAVGVFGAATALFAEAKQNSFRAAIIGHTGQGNYGHDMDIAFNGIENVTVVAVADPDVKGRAKAAQRSKASRQYADYREMLRVEKPNLVSIGPRWSDQHFDMTRAALESGAHLYVEKPFTRTLTEADELLRIARDQNLAIAVAHQMRMSPGVMQLRGRQGLIGELVQLRSWGKQDHRAGGEDLVVLGTHIFDMMRLFAGDPVSCSAEVWHQGESLKKDHAREAGEKVGLVAGTEVEARFTFPRNVTATFTSRSRLRDTLGPWALELIGTKGVARILMDIDPRIYVMKSQPWTDAGRTEHWTRFDQPKAEGFAAANKRVVEDLLRAIADRREPASSGHNGMKSMEMVMGVYQAALNGAVATFPLKERKHPLAR